MLIIISCISIIYKVIHNNVDNLRLNVKMRVIPNSNSIIKTPEVQLSVTIFAFLTLNTAT